MLIAPISLDDVQVYREFKKGEVHSYRIHVETDETLVPLKYDYSLWTRCKDPGSDQADAQIEIRILNLCENANGQTVRRAKAGFGTLTLAGTGLTSDLRERMRDAPFWCPLLSLYLPPVIKDGKFDVDQAIGAGWKMAGKGTLGDNGFDFTGKIQREAGKASDVKMIWTIDDHGWLKSGEGTLIDPSGTVSFKVNS